MLLLHILKQLHLLLFQLTKSLGKLLLSVLLLIKQGLELLLISLLLPIMLELHLAQLSRMQILHFIPLFYVEAQHVIFLSLLFLKLAIELSFFILEFPCQTIDFSFFLSAQCSDSIVRVFLAFKKLFFCQLDFFLELTVYLARDEHLFSDDNIDGGATLGSIADSHDSERAVVGARKQ